MARDGDSRIGRVFVAPTLLAEAPRVDVVAAERVEALGSGSRTRAWAPRERARARARFPERSRRTPPWERLVVDRPRRTARESAHVSAAFGVEPGSISARSPSAPGAAFGEAVPGRGKRHEAGRWPAPATAIEYRGPVNGDELRTLRAENARLRAMLERHGITFPAEQETPSGTAARDVTILRPSTAVEDDTDRPQTGRPATSGTCRSADTPSALSPDDKVRLFRSRFAGREDVHALRWESAATGRSGYAPSRVPPWQSTAEAGEGGFVDHEGRHHLPLTDDVIRRHLLGEHVVGLYPLDRHSRCRLVVSDFDDGP